MEAVLENISTLIRSNLAIAPLLALVGGVLTSFTPCSLSTLPLVIAYVTSTEEGAKGSFRYSLLFVLGSAVTFTALGIIASFAGMLIGNAGPWWYIFLGILMVLMALQIWGVFDFIPSTHLIAKNKKRGYIGAFLAGILGGIFSSPCSTPVLVVLLSIAAGGGNILWGALLLLCYSAGHGILALIAGSSTGFFRAMTTNVKYAQFHTVIKVAMGSAVLLIGFYMFYLGF